MRITLPRRWQRTRYALPPRPKDEEDFTEDEDEESEEEGEEEQLEVHRSRNSAKPLLWMALSVVGTLAGRKMLRGGFGESFFGLNEGRSRANG